MHPRHPHFNTKVFLEIYGNLISGNEVLFIRGQNSNYILDEDSTIIEQKFPGSQLETIEHAGHWVHAERPDEFLRVLNKFLQQ